MVSKLSVNFLRSTALRQWPAFQLDPVSSTCAVCVVWDPNQSKVVKEEKYMISIKTSKLVGTSRESPVGYHTFQVKGIVYSGKM